VGLFSKIETRDDALKAVRDCAGGFFVVAAISGLAGAFLVPSMLIDAVLIGAFAFVLRTWHWRLAAIVLLVMALFILVSTVGNRLGITSQGGGNIYLAVLMVLVGIRSVQATFILAKKPATTPPTMAPRMPHQAARR
jgi:choline-glycine betaine transporter